MTTSERHLRRPLDRALIGGVCAGVSDLLGIPPLAARAGMLAVAAASGIGFVLYPVAWALIPAEGARPPSWRARLGQGREAAAIILLTAAALLALRGLGLWLGPEVLGSLLLASCGVALILYQVLILGEPRMHTAAVRRWQRWPAAALGTGLILGAAVLFLRYLGLLGVSGHTLAGGLVIVFAAALLIAPYLVALARRLSLERLQRIRSEERAEVAAHLHDSVLQTLALIQRRADDPAQVMSLARRQERELREWLLEGERAPSAAATVRGAIEQLAQDVEALHAIQVETVVVGDAALDDGLTALLAATREALVNAAKFSGAPRVDIYAEADERRVDVFVRDRGVGFDPAGLPSDRHGIRHSICDRMARHGGTAAIRSAPGEGTEVELTLERT